MGRRHQMGARPRQLAFLPIRKGIRQHHADHKRQHGVAQKLHLLIVARPVGRLLRKRGVRESFQQELKVTKLVADRNLKLVGVVFRHASRAPIPCVMCEEER